MLTKNELYQALEKEKPSKPVVTEHFQCYKDEMYHEQFNGINLSSLFTLLIREAARLCDHYTSDIFYDLEKLNNDLKGENTVLYEQGDYKYVIGIRDYGTDGESFIVTRNAGECDTFTYLYRAIYYIKVYQDGRHFKKLECYKIEPYSLDFYFDREKAKEIKK